jgi:hypothetical protein
LNALPAHRRLSEGGLPWRVTLAAGAACLLVAAAMLTAVPVLFGSPARAINISWHHLARGERTALEERFRLSEGAQRESERWTYVPRDTTPALLAQRSSTGSIAARFGWPTTAR